MKYFNVEIQVTGETAAAAIYDRLSRDDAITNFHTSMASMRAAVDAGTLDEASGLVINSWGGIEVPAEHYKPTPAPEPEE